MQALGGAFSQATAPRTAASPPPTWETGPAAARGQRMFARAQAEPETISRWSIWPRRVGESVFLGGGYLRGR